MNTASNTEKTAGNINTCDECKSQYYVHTSAMASLCPQCTHVLYGYDNCSHSFENGRCVHCFWDGSTSAYIKSLTTTR